MSEETTSPEPLEEKKIEMTQDELDAKLEQARLDGIRTGIATTSHYINNAVAVILGYAEMLQGEPTLPPDQQEFIANIGAGADRVGDVMKKIQMVHPENYIYQTEQNGPTFIDLDKSWDKQVEADRQKPQDPDRPF